MEAAHISLRKYEGSARPLSASCPGSDRGGSGALALNIELMFPVRYTTTTLLNYPAKCSGHYSGAIDNSDGLCSLKMAWCTWLLGGLKCFKVGGS